MSAHTDLQKIEEKETLPTEIEKCILYCSNKQKYDVNYIDAILAATELADKNAELSALRARVEALEHLEAVAQDVNEWLKTSAGLKGSAHQRELEAALKA